MKAQLISPAVVLSLLLAGIAMAGNPNPPPVQDDAGSGGDAGDSPSSATALPGTGTYDGTLLPGDADWFWLESATGLGCADLSATGPAAARTSLVDRGGASDSSQRLHALHRPSLGLATGGTDTMVAFRSLIGGAPAGVGRYVFDVDYTSWNDLGPGDGGTGTDAGDRLTKALIVDPSCVGGRLNAAESDSVDVYSFAVRPGLATFSLAEAAQMTINYRLLNSTGVEVARGESGSAVVIPVDEDALWFAEFTPEGSSTATYTFALSLDSDPTRPPCRPHCDSLEIQSVSVERVVRLSEMQTSDTEDPTRPPCRPHCDST